LNRREIIDIQRLNRRVEKDNKIEFLSSRTIHIKFLSQIFLSDVFLFKVSGTRSIYLYLSQESALLASALSISARCARVNLEVCIAEKVGTARQLIRVNEEPVKCIIVKEIILPSPRSVLSSTGRMLLLAWSPLRISQSRMLEESLVVTLWALTHLLIRTTCATFPIFAEG